MLETSAYREICLFVTHGLTRAFRSRPDEIAYTFEGHERTWRQFADRVARAASGLVRLGVRRDDRLAILSENTAAFYELYMAAPWSGAIMASINTRWAVSEMVECLNDSGADVLLVDRAFAPLVEQLRAGRPSIREVIFADEGDAPTGLRSWEALIAENQPAADAGRGSDEVVYLFYTSGTTGRAKGAMLTASGLWIAALSGMATTAVKPQSVLMHAMPLFHVAGGGMLMMQLMANARGALLRRFQAEAVLAAISKHRVTHVNWVATMLNMVLDSPNLSLSDLGSIERVLYGGAPMSQALLRRALNALPNAGFSQGYGMTETSASGTMLSPDDYDPDGQDLHRLMSAGRTAPGVELKIVDGDGREVGADVVGQICIGGPTVTAGYWQQPEMTAEAIRDGWLHTGDGGYLDKDGYLYVVDRLKDMIITGGENVYSAEVEDAVHKHPAVKECAVIGLPDDLWGERVAAVVHLKGGASLTQDDLVAHCRALIGGYKVPRQLILSTEPLPKNGAGKILKHELRRFAAQFQGEP